MRNYPKHFRENFLVLIKWFCVVQIVFAIVSVPLFTVLFDDLFLLALPNILVFGILYYVIESRYDPQYKSIRNKEFTQ